MDRVALLVGLVVVLFLGLFWGVHTIVDHHEQKERHAFVEKALKKHNKVKKDIEDVEMPEEADFEKFEEVIKLAQKEEQKTRKVLKANKGKDVHIEDEDFEKIQKASHPEKGKYYRFVTSLDSMDEEAPAFINSVVSVPEKIDYALEYKNRDQYVEAPKHHKKSLKEVPSLIQWSNEWGFMPYGDMRIGFSGCGPTCLSMVFSYLKQDDTITPPVICELSESKGMYVDGVGTSHALMSEAAKAYDISCEGIPLNKEDVTKALEDNKILIASVLPGDFTTTGHFIVIRGMKEGKLMINDPNSPSRSKKLWDIDRVLDQTQSIWAYSK